MPSIADAAEFYVYRFEVQGIPFYVGVGRSGRAGMRVSWVRSQLAREAAGKPGKWTRHTRVIAGLMEAGHEPALTYIARGLKRAEALAAERAEISRLRLCGTVLANIQQNLGERRDAAAIVKQLLEIASLLPTSRAKVAPGAKY